MLGCPWVPKTSESRWPRVYRVFWYVHADNTVYFMYQGPVRDEQ